MVGLLPSRSSLSSLTERVVAGTKFGDVDVGGAGRDGDDLGRPSPQLQAREDAGDAPARRVVSLADAAGIFSPWRLQHVITADFLLTQVKGGVNFIARSQRILQHFTQKMLHLH